MVRVPSRGRVVIRDVSGRAVRAGGGRRRRRRPRPTTSRCRSRGAGRGRRRRRPSDAAHQRVAARFRAVGLRVGYERFTVPGKGPSRDVIGIRDAPERLPGDRDGAHRQRPARARRDDNASGVGTLVALARSLATEPAPACDVWLVATGAEERPYTGQPDHLGASALVAPAQTRRPAEGRPARALARRGRPRLALRPALDRDAPARERRAAHPRRRRRQRALGARPAGEGNSDHRELARAGAPAAKLGVVDEPCRHTACDTPDRLERGGVHAGAEDRLAAAADLELESKRISPSTLPPGSVTKASLPTPSIAVGAITTRPAAGLDRLQRDAEVVDRERHLGPVGPEPSSSARRPWTAPIAAPAT